MKSVNRGAQIFGRAGRSIVRELYRLSIAVVAKRSEFPVLLERRGLTGTGVEVGVKRGEFSDLILSRWNGRLLISVDPWVEVDADQYVDISNVSQENQDAFYKETIARLARHGNRSEIWRKNSKNASQSVRDESLDFVYLDARHDYASVIEDLNVWWGKIRPGGIIAGHDYVDGDLPEGVFGVKSAVDDFFAREHVSVASTFAREKFPSWIAAKPTQSKTGSRASLLFDVPVRAIVVIVWRCRDMADSWRSRHGK